MRVILRQEQIAENADGVIRLTAYDLSVRPPQPVAERLVYRRPAHKLDIQVANQDEKHAPGDQVELGLSVQDENGQPRQAVLGVSVVDDALPALADDKSPRMTTHFWLTTSGFRLLGKRCDSEGKRQLSRLAFRKLAMVAAVCSLVFGGIPAFNMGG